MIGTVFYGVFAIAASAWIAFAVSGLLMMCIPTITNTKEQSLLTLGGSLVSMFICFATFSGSLLTFSACGSYLRKTVRGTEMTKGVKVNYEKHRHMV